MQYSKMVILILIPEVMNSTAANMYSRYGFAYHSHLTKDRNIFYWRLFNIINVHNKL